MSKQPNLKLVKTYKHKTSGKVCKISPWWECLDPIFDEKDIYEAKGRKVKIGTLFQVGWLVENEENVYIGLPMSVIEQFEEVKDDR